MSFFDRLFRRGSQLEERALDAEGVERVAGERGVSAVQRPPSLQSRISNLLAMGLMGTLAIAFLGWYYVHSLGMRSSARQAAQSSTQEKARGEMTVPPLGRVDPPATAPSRSLLEGVLGQAPGEPPPTDAPAGGPRSTPYPPPAPYGTAGMPATKTPEEIRLERQLGGPAFVSPATNSATSTVPAIGEGPGAAGSGDDIAGLLRARATPAASATVLSTQRLLLPKGAFIDCTLETAIDTSLPGMTTCIMATDAFSADGSVVLLERGTKLVGETRGQVHEGSARVFVLWTEARTPKGVIVPLASPGTDELGRSGLPGEVNRHFFERFGAAILISVIEGAIQAEVQSHSQGGSTLILNPAATQDVTTEVLKSTVAIPPTVVKPQGDRIQVLVARDLDFRSVYELRPIAAGR